jgi:hypothetical protein
MNKQVLIDTIDKYYLNGITEKVKWVIKNNDVDITFITPNKDMIGIIKGKFEIKDCEIAVFDTSQLLKLINITDSFLTMDIQYEGKIATKLLIADKEYNLEYALADLMLIPKLPSFNEPPYDYSFNINNELIDKFIKAKKALGCDTFKINATTNEIEGEIVTFTLGDDTNHSNKIIFNVSQDKQLSLPLSNEILFNANYIKEIFDSNKNLQEGICKVSNQGLIKFDFICKDNQTSSYIVVAKD